MAQQAAGELRSRVETLSAALLSTIRPPVVEVVLEVQEETLLLEWQVPGGRA
jgi:hypothetical protein